MNLALNSNLQGCSGCHDRTLAIAGPRRRLGKYSRGRDCGRQTGMMRMLQLSGPASMARDICEHARHFLRCAPSWKALFLPLECVRLPPVFAGTSRLSLMARIERQRGLLSRRLAERLSATVRSLRNERVRRCTYFCSHAACRHAGLHLVAPKTPMREYRGPDGSPRAAARASIGACKRSALIAAG